ncbi:hypothetical protein [Vibrio cholerae]|uniref:hypothetical protein n=1 Tax=Vibrio cholerae TaxID=666 RepID=UPI000E685257|nr:hypothetical protein [Vibrio cholerae]MDV2400303.1 hypothetical protein [Vibrio cholerae]
MPEYQERDIMELDKVGNHYGKHVLAMTREDLRSKSDIAAELGYRDMVIESLSKQRDDLAKYLTHLHDYLSFKNKPYKDGELSKEVVLLLKSIKESKDANRN